MCYYPFGMNMPNRKYTVNSEYRYGFNGKENSPEISSGAVSFEARIYDSRIGKFFSVDPRANDYPWQTTYAFHRNNPIAGIDYLGAGDPPVEPTRQSVKIKKNQNLWSIAKNALPSGASNNSISGKVNDIKCINNIGSDGVIHKGQTIYLETEGQFKGRHDQYLREKQAYDWKEFSTFPIPIQNPENKKGIRQRSMFDEQGNLSQTARNYSTLLDNSFSGVDVTVLKGGLVDDLMISINKFGAPDGQNMYQNIANEFRQSGASYIYDKTQVRFGVINKGLAATQGGTWIMRNAQIKYWVSYNANGTINIKINAYDYFNVTPQDDKDGTYNSIAKTLDALHQGGGANPNMQTRATWEVNIK
jgi:RHS repeat-associated protein